LEKGGFKQELEKLNCSSSDVVFSDEMRLGLRGQVRKVLAPKGVKVVQRLQMEYRYEYLLLSVNPISGVVNFAWIPRMNQASLKPVLAEWKLELVVWDGAGSHRGKRIGELGLKRIFLPSYSPELNPAERVFLEIRRCVEGLVYSSLAEKKLVVERWLVDFAGDVERVKRLCGWSWIQENLCLT
jgi:transposase